MKWRKGGRLVEIEIGLKFTDSVRAFDETAIFAIQRDISAMIGDRVIVGDEIARALKRTPASVRVVVRSDKMRNRVTVVQTAYAGRGFVYLDADTANKFRAGCVRIIMRHAPASVRVQKGWFKFRTNIEEEKRKDTRPRLPVRQHVKRAPHEHTRA